MTKPFRSPTPLITHGARAGLVAPVVFTLTWVAQEILRLEEYSPVREPVSALAAGPAGWVQSLNFAVFGLLTVVFALGLSLGLRSSVPGVVGSALFLVSGLGLMMAAAFPLREDATGATYDPGGHALAGMTFFTASALALVVISFALPQRADTRSLTVPVRVAGLLLLVANPIMGVLVIPGDAPLHEWAGLAQRVLVLALLFPARMALAHRLLRMAPPAPVVRPRTAAGVGGRRRDRRGVRAR